MTVGTDNLMSIAGSRVRVCFGRGQLQRLGELAAAEGARRVMLVTDAGIVAAGHAERGAESLRKAGIETIMFAGAQENPTTVHLAAGLAVAQEHRIDFIVGLGGGSSMDCAKGINFLYSNGGVMQDYRGLNKATKPMLPLIAVPTTAGTGSDAQSFALISDPATHEKMACGDSKALPRVAILDPDLVDTCPRAVAAATGIDAIAHSVESCGSTKRTEISRGLSKQAWELLSEGFGAMFGGAENRNEKTGNMLLGAHFAGAAIENSMLGAAHAAANPLTAEFGIVHGRAVGVMLPHVVRFNCFAGNPYSDLDADGERLAGRLQAFLKLAGLPGNLEEAGVARGALAELSRRAALQWTATFNPRPVTAADFLELYERAWR